MSPPLAYFLTWTCYGQRLHGDPRGSIDRQHNTPGTPPLAPDPARERRERDAMTTPPVELSPPMRELAASAIEDLCTDRRWRLLAHNVRSTHVHIVVNCAQTVSPERAMAQFKARITRDLRRARLTVADARLWTRHGSTRWVNHEPGLIGAIAYVNDWQSGPAREILEEHRRRISEQIVSLRSWLNSLGLPEHGRTVVWGEQASERAMRVGGSHAAET